MGVNFFKGFANSVFKTIFAPAFANAVRSGKDPLKY